MLPLLSNVNYILITCLSLHITRFFLALHPAPTPSLTYISLFSHHSFSSQHFVNGTPCNKQNISNGGYRVIKEKNSLGHPVIREKTFMGHLCKKRIFNGTPCKNKILNGTSCKILSLMVHPVKKNY